MRTCILSSASKTSIESDIEPSLRPVSAGADSSASGPKHAVSGEALETRGGHYGLRWVRLKGAKNAIREGSFIVDCGINVVRG